MSITEDLCDSCGVLVDQRETENAKYSKITNNLWCGICNLENLNAIPSGKITRLTEIFDAPASAPTAYIFDMDGTLVDTSSIVHHVLNRPKNFNAFHSEAEHCPPHEDVVVLLRNAMLEGHEIIIVTARGAMWKDVTTRWLDNNNITYSGLYMRGIKDYRKDYLVKKDILKKIREKWDVVHAVDDNPAVIKLWQEEGIPTTTIPGYYDDIQ
jgi:hypothetical protein